MITSDKTALFVDGANLHHTAKALGFDVDFKRLIEEFEKRGSILRSYYYTTISEVADFTAIRPLVDWLEYNGFTAGSFGDFCVKLLPTRDELSIVQRRGTKRQTQP